MAVMQYFALPTAKVSLLRKPVNAVQLYKHQDSKEAKMERNYSVAMKDMLIKETHWIKQV